MTTSNQQGARRSLVSYANLVAARRRTSCTMVHNNVAFRGLTPWQARFRVGYIIQRVRLELVDQHTNLRNLAALSTQKGTP